MSYTKEVTEKLIEMYLADIDNEDIVDELAIYFDKPRKSIIGKLSKEGVYRKKTYKTKQGKDPVTKKELVQEIAELLDINYEAVAGLEKSPKTDLRKLRDTIYEYAAAGEDNLDGWQLIWRGE